MGSSIEIDDDLVRQVMQEYGFKTNREAVEYALRQLVPAVRELMSLEEALAMRGTGWDGDLDEMRGPRSPES